MLFGGRNPRQVEDHIPLSMRSEVAADPAKLFDRARRDAALGHGEEREAAKALPSLCPYSFDQIVSPDWYPQNRHGIVDDFEDDASA